MADDEAVMNEGGGEAKNDTMLVIGLFIVFIILVYLIFFR